MPASRTRIHTHPRICTHSCPPRLLRTCHTGVRARQSAHAHLHERNSEKEREDVLCVGVHTRTHTHIPAIGSQKLVIAVSLGNFPPSTAVESELINSRVRCVSSERVIHVCV